MDPEALSMWAAFKGVAPEQVLPCRTFEDMDALVAERGMAYVRRMLRDPTTAFLGADEQLMAERWLLLKEAEDRERQATESIRLAEQAASASKKSAQWTLWAAIFTAVGAVATAYSAWKSGEAPLVQSAPPAASSPAKR